MEGSGAVSDLLCWNLDGRWLRIGNVQKNAFASKHAICCRDNVNEWTPACLSDRPIFRSSGIGCKTTDQLRTQSISQSAPKPPTQYNNSLLQFHSVSGIGCKTIAHNPGFTGLKTGSLPGFSDIPGCIPQSLFE